MRIKLPHAPYIARKISVDLLNSNLVTMQRGIEPVSQVAFELLREDILKERLLEEKVNEILDDNEGEIEFMQVDRKSMFWLIKKKLALQEDFILSYEDRYNDISHNILESIWKKDLIDYSVSENKVRNIIYGSIQNYLKNYEKVEDIVFEKIEALSKKPVAGSIEYDILFEKLYEQELRQQGIFWYFLKSFWFKN